MERPQVPDVVLRSVEIKANLCSCPHFWAALVAASVRPTGVIWRKFQKSCLAARGLGPNSDSFTSHSAPRVGSDARSSRPVSPTLRRVAAGGDGFVNGPRTEEPPRVANGAQRGASWAVTNEKNAPTLANAGRRG